MLSSLDVSLFVTKISKKWTANSPDTCENILKMKFWEYYDKKTVIPKNMHCCHIGHNSNMDAIFHSVFIRCYQEAENPFWAMSDGRHLQNLVRPL